MLKMDAFQFCYWTLWLLIAVGFALTLYSYMGLCTAECVVGHRYRIYGFHFETLGFLFFTTLALFHIVTWWQPHLLSYTYLAIIGALGAEALFLMVQKFWIGHWCPICVSIALTLLIAAGALKIYFFNQISNRTKKIKDQKMNKLLKGTSTLSVFVLGFAFAFLGISQVSPLESKEAALKEQLTFGNKQSDIEVYIFTDWACPACRTVEPELESVAPKIVKRAKLYFVDFVIHPETLNYSPYNVSFMLHNKEKYLLLRHILTKLSTQTGSPTEDQVEAIAEKVHTNYHPISYSEVATATKYFKKLGTKFRVLQTPTVVIVNTETKQGKRLEGVSQVNQNHILDAIKDLSS